MSRRILILFGVIWKLEGCGADGCELAELTWGGGWGFDGAMDTTGGIDFEGLWAKVLRDYRGDPEIHGPAHWRRVEGSGLQIAADNGADADVVRLFAVLHDSRRVNDSHELKHGELAAEYAETLRGKWFPPSVLKEERFAKLTYACRWHTHGKLSEDATIGACWDADRLDLGRVGLIPEARFMSTRLGKELAGG